MTGDRNRIMQWVATEVLPHEKDLRTRLRRSVPHQDLDDIIQEAYFRISRLTDVGEIRSGRAYLFTTARMLLLERIRRARIVNIDAIADIEALQISTDAPSPERVTGGKRELDRVRRLIQGLPERCRKILELRKIEGLPQRQVAEEMGLPEYTVENDVAKALKLILGSMIAGEEAAEEALSVLAPMTLTKDGGQRS
ncbi:RNA polymerase sigma-70 factor, ECF subfamily [Sphingobium sp. AP50]|uniref:RNA polymerase sigma factor n=1 Tax=Sphingobium sp. AP50 TaxID=1884369 RepID=UPI0008C13E81|nr:sigma-70 family RNA polymerase sigma factor [Sphingobium sp. AP50]SEJ73589.1 RNA polymerase sigma-70 factor, ECF subfamily [Sphingobium sp. AP50]